MWLCYLARFLTPNKLNFSKGFIQTWIKRNRYSCKTRTALCYLYLTWILNATNENVTRFGVVFQFSRRHPCVPAQCSTRIIGLIVAGAVGYEIWNSRNLAFIWRWEWNLFLLRNTIPIWFKAIFTTYNKNRTIPLLFLGHYMMFLRLHFARFIFCSLRGIIFLSVPK